MKKHLFSALVLALVGSALPGCLALSGPPEVELGEHCVEDANCPDNAVCRQDPNEYQATCHAMVTKQWGEACATEAECPPESWCSVPPGGAAQVCYPKLPECSTEEDPVCGGYDCDMTWKACRKSCASFAQCIFGYVCQGADPVTGALGTCVVP